MMKKFLFLLPLLLLCACQPKNITQNLTLTTPTNQTIAVEKATYLKDIDGDTITVLYNGVTQNVRLIGIDTPESKRNAKAKTDSIKLHKSLDVVVAQGKEAAKYTSSLLKKNDAVLLEFDKTKTDKYGRLLAYVYFNNKMINDTVISDGYAYPMTIKPNVKYAKQFETEYQQAVKDKKGLWKK